MPIYAYKCESCGLAKDVLQKISDPQLTDCPACGQSTFRKQVTAAGFQLKGSGWYVTDFRGGNAPASSPAPAANAAAGNESGSSGGSTSSSSSTSSESSAPSVPAVASASKSGSVTGGGDK